MCYYVFTRARLAAPEYLRIKYTKINIKYLLLTHALISVAKKTLCDPQDEDED